MYMKRRRLSLDPSFFHIVFNASSYITDFVNSGIQSVVPSETVYSAGLILFSIPQRHHSDFACKKNEVQHLTFFPRVDYNKLDMHIMRKEETEIDRSK